MKQHTRGSIFDSQRMFLFVFGSLLLLLLPTSITAESCASIPNCTECLDAYTCHWCEHSGCHAKGSWHGCAWGASTCSPEQDNNNTCASHSTCSDCALASHLCHWCEHDNTCHTIGSRYGCAVGVNCYNSERCRRTEPELLTSGRFPIPPLVLIAVLFVAFVLIACLGCCRGFIYNLSGAYNDLATLAASASLRPPSMINAGPLSMATDPFYSALSTQPEEDNQDEDNNEDEEEQEVQEPESGETNNQEYTLLEEEDEHDDEINNRFDGRQEEEDDALIQGSPHIKALYKTCSILYYSTVSLILILVVGLVLFYPQIPTYSVCNDAVGWTNIITKLVSGKLDASFEILVSFKNPNYLSAFLKSGGGTFTFQNEPLGTYIIPPFLAQGLAVTDLMLIAHATPNHNQALQLAKDYMAGKLVLTAEFDATIEIPALFNAEISKTLKDISIDVNSLADRSLCHCPSWSDNKTVPLLLF